MLAAITGTSETEARNYVSVEFMTSIKAFNFFTYWWVGIHPLTKLLIAGNNFIHTNYTPTIIALEN
jgi:hypothetical protein